MIQFRWKPCDIRDENPEAVNVNGQLCVLEFKQHFMPALRAVQLPNGETTEITVLESARPCDKEWKEVKISE